MTFKFARTLGLAVAGALLLAGCFVVPGKFVSTLDLRKNGHFAFNYTGEINVLGLSKLADMGSKADHDKAVFEAQACYKEDDSLDERPCTAEETAKQKHDWETAQAESAARDRKNAEALQAMLGGIDPNSPQAGEELAERLRKQAGWKSVVYKGNGLYVVDFAMAGVLDHDFTFPTIERMPMVAPFVALNLRADNAVRIDAQAFGPASSANPMSNFAQMAAMGGPGDGKADDAKPALPTLDGTFTIVTDAPILANNTNDGPVKDSGGQRLEWKVNARTQAAPMALIGPLH